MLFLFWSALAGLTGENHKNSIDWHNGSGLDIGKSEIDWQDRFHNQTSITNFYDFNYYKSKKYSAEESNPQKIILRFSEKKFLSYDASSEYHKNYSARNALDGNRKSSWLSQKSAGAHWLALDFGSKRLFDRMILRLGNLNGERTIVKYNIQFFYKGSWFDFLKVDLSNKPIDKDDYRYLGGVDASRFRIYIPAHGTLNGFAAIREIELYLGKSLVMHLDPRIMTLAMPIANGLLPEDDYLFPNAPRAYRGGVHAGIDITHFYDPKKNYQARPLSANTKILAAQDGVVVRADHNYIARNKREYEKATRYSQNNSTTFVLRSFGGRQVWIDHENGILTTYNHLSSILPTIGPGMKVKKGQLIGYAGNSGLKGESYKNGQGVHLHFEIWVDGEFLGKDMPVSEVRKIFSWMFADSGR
jgi:murein DD-endopeptidase MepM/ murein hydrolase activator NlpD